MRSRLARLVATVGGALLFLAPITAGGQPRMPRVVVFGVTPANEVLAQAFKQGLGEGSFVDGRNVIIEYRDAGGAPERLSSAAAQLARPDVDLIFARGAAALAAARQVAGRIPTVAVDFESDPVAMGFVRTLAQPGGNITGVFLDLPELSAKQLQLLKEIIRPVTRVAILGDPVLNAPQFRATEAAARTLAIQSQVLEVTAVADLPKALQAARAGRASAVLLLSSPLMFNQRVEIATLARQRRLPVVSMFVEFAEAGGLMAYGPSLREAFARAGAHAGRILHGAKPAEIPVERPSKFEWAINQKTANALGVTIPPTVLARAHQIFE